MKFFLPIVLLLNIAAIKAQCQSIEKVMFDPKDSADGYYLAVKPSSNTIKGVVVLCTSFSKAEWMLAETKLHNVGYANDLLVIFFSLKMKIFADSSTVNRLSAMLTHVANKYKADTSKFVLGGYDFAGNAILRFTERAHEHPSKLAVRPKAVFAIGSPVDLFALWQWCERQVKRKSRSAWDANFIMELMTKEYGTLTNHTGTYDDLNPFNASSESLGHAQYLKNIPVRLYYDLDPEWLVRERQSSLYDTFVPEGTELVSRLLSSGNREAEVIFAKQPGKNSRGIRSTNALSILDEVDCIHWIKNKLDIFDPNTTIRTYQLFTPKDWTEERFPIPIDFAPSIKYNGVEDVRFAPGWGDSKSQEYWSYAYLWWLEGKQNIEAETFQNNLTAYYSGLVERNIKERNIPSNKLIPTEVKIKPVLKGGKSDYFEGTIKMLDYMTQQPILLHCRIHVTSCTTQDRTAVIVEISPKPDDHPVWKSLDQIRDRFDCAAEK